MKRQMKKLLALILTLVMVLGIAPTAAFAQDEVIEHTTPVSIGDNTLAATGQCGDNVYWTFDETGLLTINGIGAMWDYDPSWYDFSPFYVNSSIRAIKIESGVTSIGKWAFESCTSLTSIEIPDSVTSIGNDAFSGCTSLTSVEIGNGVTSIGDGAFRGCTSLTSIEIPDSVTSIDDQAFYGCKILTSVTIGDGVTSVGGNAFGNCTSLKDVFITDIDSWAQIDFENENATPFYYAENLYLNNELATDVVLSDGVTDIGSYAFYYCKSLTSIEIPDSVTSIGRYAFYYCSSLTSIEIPDSVTSIGSYTFCNCSSLTCIEIPDSVTSIGNYAFAGCSSLTSIEIPNSVTSIGDSAFYYCSRLTSIEIPDSVTRIGYYAFQACSSLTSIEIPNSVTSIGKWAFYNCTSLTSIDIPDSVTSIGDYAFEYCSSLTSVDIPDSVTSIGEAVFYNCTSLTSIDIPDSVTSIGDWAFADCSSLTSINIPDSVTSIGGDAFAYCTSLTSIEIPDSVTSLGSSTFYGCTGLISITVDKNNKNYSSDEFGVLYNKDKTKFIQYPIGNERTSFTIPDSVTSIGDYAFYYCSSLTSIEIPDSVTSIGYSAFFGCSSLTSIEIPDSVTGIGEFAFAYCSSLTSIEIPDSVTSIGGGAFDGCTGLTNVTIPDSVTSIGYWAFYDCSSLTSIEIPDSVTSIGNRAFYNCSSLTSIEIPDSVTSIGYEAFYGCPDDMVFFGVPGSYAQTYAEENGIMFVAINGMPYVSLHCQPLTDTPEITVYGVANANAEVSVYDGETLLGTAKSGSNGQWSATVTLQSPVNLSEHTIKAVVTKGDESKTASTVVTYDVGAIFPTEFTLTHSEKTIDLLTSKVKNLTIVPSRELIFDITLNKKDVSSLKIFSIKNGVTKTIFATYNSATGRWVASGWFDPANHSYAPGELGLEIDGAKVLVECAKVNYLIDPSGYVYEAVKSNRVSGASAIICYQDGEHAIPWDANPYEQENPQITDEMGAYHWDVTEGMWRIKVTKSGYEAAYSDWMQVPPEWTEVAIPLVTTQSPEVKSVEKGEDGYIVTFSQYMNIDSVNSDNVVFVDNDGTIAGTITPVNKEVSGTDSSVYYASVFKFVPTDANAKATAVTIKNVINYAAKKMSGTYTQEISNEIPSHDHIPGQAVKENEVAPTCAEQGSYDEVVYCTSCGEEISREKKNVEALGHNYDSVVTNPTCTEAGYTTHTCSRCKDSYTDSTVEATGHTEGEWEVTVPATTTSEGTKTLRCSVCKKVIRTETIPMLTEQPGVNSVSISDISLGYKSSATLTPQIKADEGAKYDVTYKSNSSAVSVDNSGRVTSNKTFGFTPASAVITVTVKDSNGNTVTDTCTVSVNFSAIQWIIKIVLFGWIWY